MTTPSDVAALPLLMKPAEVAALGRISVNTVYAAVNSEALRAVRLSVHATRIPRAAALAWLGLDPPSVDPWPAVADQ